MGRPVRGWGMHKVRGGWSRGAARAALNRPDLSGRDVDLTPEPSNRGRLIHPAIAMQHPCYWHVYRVELVPDARPRHVLIAECQTEHEAFMVADLEAWQVVISRWGDRRAPFYSFRPPRPAVACELP